MSARSSDLRVARRKGRHRPSAQEPSRVRLRRWTQRSVWRPCLGAGRQAEGGGVRSPAISSAPIHAKRWCRRASLLPARTMTITTAAWRTALSSRRARRGRRGRRGSRPVWRSKIRQRGRGGLDCQAV